MKAFDKVQSTKNKAWPKSNSKTKAMNKKAKFEDFKWPSIAIIPRNDTVPEEYPRKYIMLFYENALSLNNMCKKCYNSFTQLHFSDKID